MKLVMVRSTRAAACQDPHVFNYDDPDDLSVFCVFWFNFLPLLIDARNTIPRWHSAVSMVKILPSVSLAHLTCVSHLGKI